MIIPGLITKYHARLAPAIPTRSLTAPSHELSENMWSGLCAERAAVGWLILAKGLYGTRQTARSNEAKGVQSNVRHLQDFNPRLLLLLAD